MSENATRTTCELLSRHRLRRIRCPVCGGDLQQALQIDDTVIAFCEKGCRDVGTGLRTMGERAELDLSRSQWVA